MITHQNIQTDDLNLPVLSYQIQILKRCEQKAVEKPSYLFFFLLFLIFNDISSVIVQCTYPALQNSMQEKLLGPPIFNIYINDNLSIVFSVDRYHLTLTIPLHTIELFFQVQPNTEYKHPIS